MDLNQFLSAVSDNPQLRQLVIIGGAIVLALLVRMLFVRVIRVFTRKTDTDVDDRIARQIRGPLVWTIILVGVGTDRISNSKPFVPSGKMVVVIPEFAQEYSSPSSLTLSPTTWLWITPNSTRTKPVMLS